MLGFTRGSLALRIEDHAIIGDCKSAALVGSGGSIDWLCWPRFDSAACFAALLGASDNGRGRVAPGGPGAHASGQGVSRLADGGLSAVAGPEMLILDTPVVLRGEDLRTVGTFSVEAGETIP